MKYNEPSFENKNETRPFSKRNTRARRPGAGQARPGQVRSGQVRSGQGPRKVGGGVAPTVAPHTMASRPQLPRGVGVRQAGLGSVRPRGDDLPRPLQLLPEVLDGHLDALCGRTSDSIAESGHQTE